MPEIRWSKLHSLIHDAPSDSGEYITIIDSLNDLIKETTIEDRRNEIASSKDIFFQLRESAILGKSVDLKQACSSQYMRIVKGIVIIARNLSVANQVIPQNILLPNTFLAWYLSISRQTVCTPGDLKQLYGLVCQFYFNCTRTNVVFDESCFDDHMNFMVEMLRFIDDDGIVNAYSLWLSNIMKSDAFISSLLNDIRSLEVIDKLLLRGIIAQKTEIDLLVEEEDEDKNLSSLATIQLKILKQLVTHECFGSYMKTLRKEYGFASFNKMFKIVTMLVTSSERWDLYQLTAILSWTFDIFEEYTYLVDAFFKSESTPEATDAGPLFAILSSVLDILTTLAKYQHAQKYMISYDGVHKIIKLFDILERNCLKIHFNKSSGAKNVDSSAHPVRATDHVGNVITDAVILKKRIHNNRINDSNFPGIKCFLVELLGFMSYEQKDVQDSVRELHGLELVLSNCIIDDNNPFIKERCIICIRYLLANNSTNQEFISQLEAKKAVDGDVLKKAGYKVDIDGKGNIKLTADKRNAASEEQLFEDVQK